MSSLGTWNFEKLVQEIQNPSTEQAAPNGKVAVEEEEKETGSGTGEGDDTEDHLTNGDKKMGDPTEAAELVVAGIDVAQTVTLKKIHRAKFRRTLVSVYGAAAEERLNEINMARATASEKGEKATLQLDEKDFEMLFYQNRHKAIIEDIPFTDDENERMVKAYAKLMKANGGDLPPVTGVIIATATTMLPRMVDVFTEKV